MAEEKLLPRETLPPANDDWKVRHGNQGPKRFGLKVFHRALFRWRGSEPDGLYGYVHWYRTERAREDAIETMNKSTWPVAMMKVER